MTSPAIVVESAAAPRRPLVTRLVPMLLDWHRPDLTTVAAFVVASQLLAGALGWHYAVDGYASIVAITSIWWAVGRWQRRRARAAVAGPGGVVAPHEA